MYLRIDLLKDMTEQMKLDIRKAEINALNQVGKEAKKFAADELSSVYNIQKREINQAMWVEKARAGDLRLNLMVVQKGKIPLKKFSPQKTGTGVSVEIIKGRRKTLLHSFMATMPTSGKSISAGHKGVFMRTGRFNFPEMGRYSGLTEREIIEEKFSNSIPEFFGKKHILNKIDEFVRRRLPELFNQERNKL